MAAGQGRKTQFREWLESRRNKALLTGPPAYDHRAVMELGLAREEATREAQAGREPPYSAERSVTAIVLLSMALEAWVNTELTIAYHRGTGGSERERERLLDDLLNASLDLKLRRLPRYRGGSTLHERDLPGLRAFVAVRHELIHHLPATNERGDIDRLEDLGIQPYLLSAPATGNPPGVPDIDFMLPERLGTYDLAYWSFQVVEQAVQRVQAACEPDGLMTGLLNLHQYRACPEPALLAQAARGDAGR